MHAAKAPLVSVDLHRPARKSLDPAYKTIAHIVRSRTIFEPLEDDSDPAWEVWEGQQGSTCRSHPPEQVDWALDGADRRWRRSHRWRGSKVLAIGHDPDQLSQPQRVHIPATLENSETLWGTRSPGRRPVEPERRDSKANLRFRWQWEIQIEINHEVKNLGAVNQAHMQYANSGRNLQKSHQWKWIWLVCYFLLHPL